MARQSQISKKQIVEASIEIGLSVISMHRLAKELGVSATALYRHVSNREELIQLCCDHILFQIEIEKGLSWQETLVSFAHQFRAVLINNFGAVDYLRHNQQLTAGGIQLTERIIEPLNHAKFTADNAFTAYMMIYGHVIDMVSHEEQSIRLQSSSQSSIPHELDRYPQLAWLVKNRSEPDHYRFFIDGLDVLMMGLNSLYQSEKLE